MVANGLCRSTWRLGVSPSVPLYSTNYTFWLSYRSIPAIIDTGKAHGAHPEDIYGCLYFFLRKELRTFASRLRTFSSSFTVLSGNACRLPRVIHENSLSEFKLPSSIKFDRIDVSNILDANYVGLRDVLTLWGPLLKESRSAAIVGYFMNWTLSQNGGNATTAGRDAIKRLLPRVLEKEMVRSNSIFRRKAHWITVKVNLKNIPVTKTNSQALLLASMGAMEVFYENSKPFFEFLKNQGLDELLGKTRLRLRKKHSVVPHVCGFMPLCICDIFYWLPNHA